jgi:hypothetical protein
VPRRRRSSPRPAQAAGRRRQAAAYKFFVPGLLIQLGLFGSTFVGFAIISDWRAGVIERVLVLLAGADRGLSSVLISAHLA